MRCVPFAFAGDVTEPFEDLLSAGCFEECDAFAGFPHEADDPLRFAGDFHIALVGAGRRYYFESFHRSATA